VFDDDSSHTIKIVVPISVLSTLSTERVSNAVSGISQTVTDNKGSSWSVIFSTVNGNLTDQSGVSYTNGVVHDENLDVPAGRNSNEGRTYGTGNARGARAELGNNPTDKVIAHEVGGHAGGGLDDVYDVRTRETNTKLPGNLMNNDPTGGKLTWGQVQDILSPKSGNEVLHQPDRTWRQWLRDNIGI
jgi:hypothetical protein